MKKFGKSLAAAVFVCLLFSLLSFKANPVTPTGASPKDHAAVDYCAAGGGNPAAISYGRISNVKFNTINNPSSSIATYENFTSLSTQLKAGTSTGITITLASPSYGDNQVIVWIDFNQDGDFTDWGEQVFIINGSGPALTGNIFIPGFASAGTTRMRIRSHSTKAASNNTILNATPCGNSSQGQVEDYNLDILAASLCTGTPNPGATTSSAATAATIVMGGQSFTLDLANGQNLLSVSGISYQWQKSSDGATYSNISGATNPNCDVSGISANTSYRCNVTCAGQTVASTPIQLLYRPFCAAGSTDPTQVNLGRISNVKFNTINNSSGKWSEYENFLTVSTQIMAGTSANITVTISGGIASGQVIVWIDFNQDSDFEDPGEQVLTGNGLGPISGSILIPGTAKIGYTAMRIRSHSIGGFYPSNSTPCGGLGWGQVEDYTIIVLDNPCTSTPTPGATTSTVTPSVRAGQGFTLGFAPLYYSGNTYQWQNSTDGLTYTNISGATEPTCAVAGISANAWYQCILTCAKSGQKATSTPLKMLFSPNCAAEGSNAANTPGRISNVSFITIKNTSSGTAAYESFLNLSTIFPRAKLYPLSITLSSTVNTSNQVIVWIDLNKDGDFDDTGEKLFTGNGAGPFSTNISIPSTATLGLTTMRIRSYDTATGPNATPCGTSSTGQVEDYTINIK